MKEDWNLEMLMRVAAARLPAPEIAVGQRRRIGGVYGKTMRRTGNLPDSPAIATVDGGGGSNT